MTNEAKIHEVAQSRFPEFAKKFARLVKLAEKIDVDAPDFSIVGEVTHPRPPQTDADRQRIADRDPTYPIVPFFQITITGDAPQVPGFRFVGKIEPSEIAGINFVSAIPGIDVNITPFAKAAIECEHCQTNRARKAAYLIESTESGSIFRVGKNCLQDFTGHASPESCAKFFEVLMSILDEEWEPCCERIEPTFDTLGFVQMTAAVIQEFGWAPVSGSDWPTKVAVMQALENSGPFSGSARDRIAIPVITEAHKTLATEALAWARTLSPDPVVEKSDYLRNLRLAVEPEFVVAKRTGLLASILRAYTTAKEIEIKKAERKEQKAAAQPIPTFDGRVRVEGSIVAANWKDTDFGSVLKITVRHADGWAVYGSCPSAISGERDSSELIGKPIGFDARIKVSRDDPKFGFFSRPTKVAFEG